jgi:hypothetical protein
MADRQIPNVSTRSRERIAVRRLRWGFWKGLVTGLAIEVPAITATIWLLAQLGIGNAEVSVIRILRLTTVFAGIAALFTAGGIGRLAAYASLDGGRRRAVIVAARAHAVASAGLVLIAAIPHGQLPGHSIAWLACAAGGLIAGAACGALIGFWCGGVVPVELADVWSLARRPSEALRSWLDPHELVRLGAAVRDRTTNLFEGMFDPAPLPPPPPGSTLDAKPPASPATSPPDSPATSPPDSLVTSPPDSPAASPSSPANAE